MEYRPSTFVRTLFGRPTTSTPASMIGSPETLSTTIPLTVPAAGPSPEVGVGGCWARHSGENPSPRVSTTRTSTSSRLTLTAITPPEAAPAIRHQRLLQSYDTEKSELHDPVDDVQRSSATRGFQEVGLRSTRIRIATGPRGDNLFPTAD